MREYYNPCWRAINPAFNLTTYPFTIPSIEFSIKRGSGTFTRAAVIILLIFIPPSPDELGV